MLRLWKAGQKGTAMEQPEIGAVIARVRFVAVVALMRLDERLC